MKIRLWPEDFEKKEQISPEERFLLRNAKKSEKDGHFVTGIDPVGYAKPDVKMGMWISPAYGLITFSIYKNALSDYELENVKNYVNFIEIKIYERLLDSKWLIVRKDDQKYLKFPYKHVVVLPNQEQAVYIFLICIWTFSFSSSGREAIMSQSVNFFKCRGSPSFE